ncbi:trypsin-like peptidase domain-containing protein [Micromonospora sp. RTGN7]|uniref:nSTAND1 domain-containing NTPase n=1 Tax=Micromonospora sp. RTGN7 TaxID=3016526 RepID=UPI0029FEF2EA|nr:trypsin-like peptidase domain-containing protein [Micromonospora sp. RTGN7]
MDGARRIPIEAALVRLWKGGTPAGAGFLAGPSHLLTAAHVVATALGCPADGDPPAGVVEVDFPLLDPGRRLTAEVVAWQPVAPEHTGDVAGLRLLSPPPPGARALTFARHRSLSDAQLVMVGFPAALTMGSWVYGRTGGAVATGWVEILSDGRRPSTLEKGFSGSPVWDTELDAVIGMVVQKALGAPPRIGYLLPTDRLLPVWPELARVAEGESPFRGLRAFGEQDEACFFGRAEQAEQLARQALSVPVLCLVGPSGVGKTSLLHAGVLARLRRTPHLAVAVLRPSDGATALHALALALDRLATPDRAPADQSTPADQVDRVAALAGRLADGGGADVLAVVLAATGADRLVLVVDQFEEVLAQPEATRRALADVLAVTLRPGARVSVLLALRDTFLGACLREPAMAELTSRWLLATVAELTPSQLREVVTGPLARTGTVTPEAGLIDRIVDDVRDAPNPLPLMQFTLTELWQRRHAGLLTHRAYDELGGVRGALAGYAERVWGTLDPVAREAAQRLLAQLTRPLPELSVRRTAALADLDDAQLAVAQRLATTRLLVLRTVGATPGVELAHESLVTRWDRLRTLTDQYREFRTWQEMLRLRTAGGAGRRWLTGADLHDARRWAGTHGDQFTPAEHAFIADSLRRRNRRVLAACLVLLVIVGAVGGAWRTTAEQRAKIAAADLVRNAGNQARGDSYGANQLALRAWRTDPDVSFTSAPDWYEGVDALLPHYAGARSSGAEPAPSGTSGEPPPGEWFRSDLSQQLSADGTRLVTQDAALRPALWHLTDPVSRDTTLTWLARSSVGTGRPVVSRSGDRVAFVQSVAPVLRMGAPVDDSGLPKPDPDDYPTCRPASLLATLSCLVVYDTGARRVSHAVPLDGMTAGLRVRAMSIDPTGEVLALVTPASRKLGDPGADLNTVVLYDLRTGAERSRVTLAWRSTVAKLWLGPGGRSALLVELPSGEGGTLGRRIALSAADLTGATARRVLVDGISDVAMSADWSTVAVATRDRTGDNARVSILDTAALRPKAPVIDLRPEERSGAIALDATGSTLMLSWRRDLLSATVSNIGELSTNSTPEVSVWSLPDGVRSGERRTHSAEWGTVVPLGRGPDGPVAVLDNSTIGVALPAAGKPPPLHRLAETSDTHRHSVDDVMDRLCGLLADPNTDNAVRALVPDDAYQGELCPG